MKDERPRTKERVKVTLWTLIVPPTTWAAHFLFSYLWAAISCAKVGKFATFPTLFVVGTVIALIVIAASGWIAWRQSRVPGDAPPHQDSTDVDRLRFLAVSTMLLAGLSFVAVIYTALPVVFIGNCR
ncbi:hypothetical protein [Novosphingobium aquimarinum]|uniref:hypothetical protein n=1 Tax=Novosphingobium aquimarinum TaxID=2682494 RepID=UPI0012EBA6FD|nr:hypothetical protein [Novosphingobium aquimarinum]